MTDPSTMFGLLLAPGYIYVISRLITAAYFKSREDFDHRKGR